MPSNLILERVAEFLRSYSPFDLVKASVVENIAGSVEIIYYEGNKSIFREEEAPGSHCYVLRKGQVNLFKKMKEEDVLMDVCGEGDLFGIRSMLSNENYKLSAIVEKEALVYAIPVDRMRTLVNEYPAVSQFFAVGLASGQIIMGHKNESYPSLDLKDPQFSDPLSQLMPHIHDRKFITCHPEEAIQSVSKKMTMKGIDSAIVTDTNEIPLGIITDTDLRTQVATGLVDAHQPVKTIMTSPVISIRSNQHLGEVVLKMMNAGVHHLCITEDGTSKSPILGVISNHDLLMSQGNSPTIILRAIKKTESKDDLKVLFIESEKIRKRYLISDVPVHYIHEVASAIRDAVTQKIIELIVNEKSVLSEWQFSWIDLGSSARKEQLLKTDLDNLLIYQEGTPMIKETLLHVAEEVNHFLRNCGFSLCPAGIMAHLPGMCQTESEWNRQFQDWIYQPDPVALLKSTIFFDMRTVYGNREWVSRIKENILNHVRKQSSFLNYLAKNAIQNPPPLSFFNQFIVESSGEHKNEFDIKKRAIMPMVDAARLFAFEHSYYDSVSTIDRFKYAGLQEQMNKGIFEEAVHGYEFLLKMRAKTGLLHGDDGRFVNISSFDNIEKKIFKEIFHVIGELQKIINVRFQLDFFH